MPKITHRNVPLIVPEAAAIDTLLDRADANGAGRRLLKALEHKAGRDGMRKLMAAVYLQGMREGVDRALAQSGVGTPLPGGSAPVEHPEPVPETLLELDAANRPRSPVQLVVERFRNEELRLPALPEATLQLNRLLANPDHDMTAVVELIRKDLGLTTRVLKLAASPAYALGGKGPRNLQEAVMRLGARELGKQLLAFSNKRLFNFRCKAREKALRDLWHHGLATAVAAEHLSLDVPGLHAPTCFLHGLMHDIGRALLLQIFDEVEDGGTCFPADEVNRTIDSLHGQFGAALLQRWRFDDSFGEVAMFHHQPQKAFGNAKLVACVALAACVATRLGFGGEAEREGAPEPAHHPSAAYLGLSAERLQGVDTHLRRHFEVMSDLT